MSCSVKVQRELVGFYSLAFFSVMNMLTTIAVSASMPLTGYPLGDLVVLGVNYLLALYLLMMCTAYAPWFIEYQHQKTRNAMNITALSTTLTFVALTYALAKALNAPSVITLTWPLTISAACMVMLLAVIHLSASAAWNAIGICNNVNRSLRAGIETVDECNELVNAWQRHSKFHNPMLVPVTFNEVSQRYEPIFVPDAGIISAFNYFQTNKRNTL